MDSCFVNGNVVLVKIILRLQDDKTLAKIIRVTSVVDSRHILFGSNYC